MIKNIYLKKAPKVIFVNGFLFLVAIVTLVPIVMMWMAALRPASETMVNPLAIPSALTLDNLKDAWIVGHMGRFFVNSVIVIIPRVGGVLFLACLAGYAFAKLDFPLKKPLLYLLLFGLTIPLQALIIPVYYQMMSMKLINTYAALFLPAYGFSMPFGIFLMKTFF